MEDQKEKQNGPKKDEWGAEIVEELIKNGITDPREMTCDGRID